MPLYYFDIHDGEFHLDEKGVKCADFNEVCREARRVLPALALEKLTQGGDNLTLTVRVRDENYQTVYTASLMFSSITMLENNSDFHS